MPKISIIIPVYNVEKYLPKCLDSVINQTLEDIEIICINDCSTDGSLTILKEFASKDKRIKIIDFEVNKGVGFARNTGIDKASGEYISFLDPDDWWEPAFAAKTYNKITENDADIVQFAHNRYTDKKIQYDIVNKIQNVINGINYNEYFCDFVNLVWDKIYKTSFIKNNDIKFPLNIHPTEDVLFVLECFSYKPKVVFLPECLCNYRIDRDGSDMKKYDKLVINKIQAAKILFQSDFFKNSDDEYKKLCIQKLFGGIVYFCILTIRKNSPMKVYLSELRDFVTNITDYISKELVYNNKEFKTLINFVNIHNKQKEKHDKSFCDNTCL
jgi:glycosyltransferase involved in cell wall biosynthesis